MDEKKQRLLTALTGLREEFQTRAQNIGFLKRHIHWDENLCRKFYENLELFAQAALDSLVNPHSTEHYPDLVRIHLESCQKAIDDMAGVYAAKAGAILEKSPNDEAGKALKYRQNAKECADSYLKVSSVLRLL